MIIQPTLFPVDEIDTESSCVPIKDLKIELHYGDCLKLMPDIPDGSIDMVMADPPYGTTACKWDSIIPLEPMWEQLKRVIKKNGAIALFGTEPFSSHLRLSNLLGFKYDLIWQKDRLTNVFTVKHRFGDVHENISIFYVKQPTYNAQKVKGWIANNRKNCTKKLNYQKVILLKQWVQNIYKQICIPNLFIQ